MPTPRSGDEDGMHRRGNLMEGDYSDDPAGDDVELLRVRSPAVAAVKQPSRCGYRPCLIVTIALLAAGLLAHGMMSEWTDASKLKLVTWNIAAINNNPFEYWITHEDAAYNQLMIDVQNFISQPGERDVPVAQVFTPTMWAELKQQMSAQGWKGIDDVEARWTSDFSQRKIISGFMKDRALGDKRLASMPDRMTNTINLAGGKVANRPTVINCFAGDMTTLASWWTAWKKFMFAAPLTLPSGASQPAASLLQKIKHAKYPAITLEEEAISVPLQTLAQAIFDAILVHIVNAVSPGGKWQTLQQQMCDSLNRNKDERTLGILAETYHDASVIFLQESAGVFVKKAEDHDELGETFLVAKSALDVKRDQNSVILLRRSFFREATLVDHSAGVMAGFDKTVPVAQGDLLVMAVEDVLGRKYLLASFHGDTNGLATLPVLAAVHKLALSMPDHALLFGLDANTHTVADDPKKQGVDAFASAFRTAGYTSCWGDTPDPTSATTFNARTYLQPQLQKAAKSDEKVSKGDKNPKDFILMPKAGFEVLSAHKDNTGTKRYVEDMVFPTLQFPSDHGIVATTVSIKAPPPKAS